MATKNNPGKFDCFANAEPDEPMFVLLGRDPAAPGAIMRWATDRVDAGKNEPGDDQIVEALECAAAMAEYRRQRDARKRESGARLAFAEKETLEWRRRDRVDGDPIWVAELGSLRLSITVACEWCWEWGISTDLDDDIAHGTLEVFDEERADILEWDYHYVERAQARCEVVARALASLPVQPVLQIEGGA